MATIDRCVARHINIFFSDIRHPFSKLVKHLSAACMAVGRGERGPLDFENFSKKRLVS